MKRTAVLTILCVLLLQGVSSAQRVKGSDTLLPLTQELAEQYLEKHPESEIIVTGGGSGVGIAALPENTTDIAMASRRIKFGEKMKFAEIGLDAREVIVAYDALAVVVNPSNPVDSLTREQLEAIFRGKITNKRARQQELHEQHPFHAGYRCHHTVRETDKRRHRLYRPGISEQVRQASVGFL